jgi:hypothetical protein
MIIWKKMGKNYFGGLVYEIPYGRKYLRSQLAASSNYSQLKASCAVTPHSSIANVCGHTKLLIPSHQYRS